MVLTAAAVVPSLQGWDAQECGCSISRELSGPNPAVRPLPAGAPAQPPARPRLPSPGVGFPGSTSLRHLPSRVWPGLLPGSGPWKQGAVPAGPGQTSGSAGPGLCEPGHSRRLAGSLGPARALPDLPGVQATVEPFPELGVLQGQCCPDGMPFFSPLLAGCAPTGRM